MLLGAVAACGGQEEGDDPVALTDELAGAVTIDNDATEGPVAAVGRVFDPSGTCTGTLVARDRVLTAAHCLRENTLPASVTFCLPQAQAGDPCDRGTTPGNFAVVDWVVHPAHGARASGGTLRSFDLAVLVLASPVPANLVRDLPPVYLDGMNHAWKTGVVGLPGTLVGFGDFDGMPADGNRRFGPVGSALRLYSDPCGGLVEGHCNDHREWELPMPSVVETREGDSGGPLLLTGPDGPTVVGVDSGKFGPEPPLAANPKRWMVWAPTGDVGGDDNGEFIEFELGGDADGDGVLDALDNCPAALCRTFDYPMERCNNPDQVDLDFDDVGEACDNCPLSVCQLHAGTPTQLCTNPTQRNRDGDAWGDLCDLCPDDPASGTLALRQLDDDGDGVGNACDDCPGHVRYRPCTGPADCDEGFCRSDVGVPSSFCGTMRDGDRDGTPDLCDSCLGQANQERNSNALAEERERETTPDLASIDDQCDPVPIVRVDPQVPTPAPLVDPPGDGVGPNDVETIEADRWLGSEGAPLLASQRITYRHCTCFEPGNGRELPLDECVGKGLQCRWNNPEGGGLWHAMSLRDAAGQSVFQGDGFSAPELFGSGVSLDYSRSWPWRQDVTTGRVAGICDGTDCRTHGEIATVVRNDSGTFFSSRDDANDLRDVFAMHDTPLIELVKPVFPLPPSDECLLTPHCMSWLDPALIVEDDPRAFGRIFDSAVLLRTSPGPIAALVDALTAYDVTDDLSPGTRAAMTDPSVMWLPPVETRTALRRSDAPGIVQAALVPTDISEGFTPGFVLASAEGLIVAGEEEPPEIPPDIPELAGTFAPAPPALAAATASGPRTTSGVRGVFSGLETAVYVVGGTDAAGNASGAVWRYSPFAGTWELVNAKAGHAPSSNVLGVAYDGLRSVLYVLDVNDDDQIALGRKRTLRWARLHRLNVKTGESTLLATWPYFGRFRLVRIAAMEDGAIALITARKHHYFVTRLDVSGDRARFAGVLGGVGRVIDQPIMGEHHLVLPVIRRNRLRYVELPRSRFRRHGWRCKGL